MIFVYDLCASYYIKQKGIGYFTNSSLGYAVNSLTILVKRDF